MNFSPMTNAERQQARTDRMTAAGLKMLRNFWAYQEDEAAIRRYANTLTKRRAKKEKP